MSIVQPVASPQLPKLTQRQREICDFIRQRDREGQTPSVREIGQHFGIKSPNGVMCHLRALAKKGAIAHRPFKARSTRATVRGMIYRGEVR